MPKGWVGNPFRPGGSRAWAPCEPQGQEEVSPAVAAARARTGFRTSENETRSRSPSREQPVVQNVFDQSEGFQKTDLKLVLHSGQILTTSQIGYPNSKRSTNETGGHASLWFVGLCFWHHSGKGCLVHHLGEDLPGERRTAASSFTRHD